MTVPVAPRRVASLPEATRRYLDHAIEPGAPIAREVRLSMHGDLRLKEWAPFTAEETIQAERSMSWSAKTKLMGLPTRVFERVDQGYGQRERWLLGVVPVAYRRGPDVNRSAIERMAAESVWLPSVLLGPEVRWSSDGPDEVTFTLPLFGRAIEVSLGLSPAGGVETISLMRWGNPGGLPHGLYPFGGYVEEESTFGGFTVPTKLRLGWHFGTERFETEGEFFRTTIDEAIFGSFSRKP